MEPDVATELLALRKAQEERDQRSETLRKRLIIGALLAVIALGLLWFSGRMDPALSGIGLNKNECGTNGFGATFCGDDLKRNEESLRPIVYPAPSLHAADVRASIPSIEAYYADHGTYAGATADLLRSEYDSGLGDITVHAQAESYCIERGDYHVNGPGGRTLPGSC